MFVVVIHGLLVILLLVFSRVGVVSSASVSDSTSSASTSTSDTTVKNDIFLHIRPASSSSNTDNNSNNNEDDTITYSYIDASGLGTGTEFYNFKTLNVQLTTLLPVWTIQNNLYQSSTSNSFVGMTMTMTSSSSSSSSNNNTTTKTTTTSTSPLISCNLIRYYDYDNNVIILTGRIHDLDNDIYYEIKPNSVGRDTVAENFGRRSASVPSSTRTSAEPIQLSFWDVITNPFTVMSQLNDALWSSLSSLTRYGDDPNGEPSTTTNIDVMVIWTENAECLKSYLKEDCTLTKRTSANMRAAIEFFMIDSNIVHSNSRTNVQLSLVHAQRDASNFRESDVFEFVLRTMIRLPYGLDLRIKYQADLVTFLVDDRNINDVSPWCGIGMLPNIPGAIPFSITLPPFGYSAVVADCTAKYVPVHEWGHNMGCNHDRGTGDTCGACGNYYGYRAPSGNFRTIMAYQCRSYQCDNYQGDSPFGCPTVPYFSGDADYPVTGESLGGEDNSCRSEIRKTKKAISRYY